MTTLSWGATRGARTKIKFHPGDMSRLHVHDAHDNRYIEVPALGQEYTQGLSLWKHRIIIATARAAGDKTDMAALGRARRKIQEVVDAGRARGRPCRSCRPRHAPWRALGYRRRTDAEPRRQGHRARWGGDTAARRDRRYAPSRPTRGPRGPVRPAIARDH